MIMLHVHVNQIPRLKYILKLTKDYRSRALDEIKRWKESVPDFSSRLEAEWITQEKIDLFYRENFKNLELEKWNEKKSMKSEDKITSIKEAKEENFGKLSIYLTSNSPQTSLHQNLTPKHKNDITKFLEQDMYDYVSLVNEELKRQRALGTNHLRDIILTGQAILNENPKREKPNVDKFWKDELMSKLGRIPGVLGCGVDKDGVCVLAENTSKQEKDVMQEEIVRALEFKIQSKVIWVEKGFFQNYTHSGGRLIPGRYKTLYTSSDKKYGSIGVFGTTAGGKVVATTAGHLFAQEGEKAYIVKTRSTGVDEASPPNEKLEMIGTCLASLGNDADFALVNIDEAQANFCSKTISHPDYEQPLEVDLYKEGPGNLIGEFVQTLQTDLKSEGENDVSCSMGIVKIESQIFKGLKRNRNFLAISNVDANKPFAFPGHSGAPVLKLDFKSGEFPVAKVVATILFGPRNATPQKNSDSENPEASEDDVSNCVIAWRLDEALKETEDEKKWKVDIKTSNVTSLE